MLFTTVRSKEKDYDIYLKSDWFTASRSTKKMFPSYLEVEKTGSISSLTNTVAAEKNPC